MLQPTVNMENTPEDNVVENIWDNNAKSYYFCVEVKKLNSF